MQVDTVTVGDADLEVRRCGAGSPLVFLHGDDGLIFSTPLLEALGASFEVHAPHLPGFGRSTRPRYVNTVHDLALVVAEYLATFTRPVTLMGASFGAWVALDTALIVRAEVADLVLAAPVGIKLGTREERDFEDVWVADFDALPGIYYGDIAKAPDLTALTDDDLLHLTTCQESVARYAWAPYMHDPALRHWARRVHCPAAVVSGSEDRFALLPDYYERFAGLFGDRARHHVIAGAGHRVDEEAPDELAELVKAFVASRDDAVVAAERG